MRLLNNLFLGPRNWDCLRTVLVRFSQCSFKNFYHQPAMLVDIFSHPNSPPPSPPQPHPFPLSPIKKLLKVLLTIFRGNLRLGKSLLRKSGRRRVRWWSVHRGTIGRRSVLEELLIGELPG